MHAKVSESLRAVGVNQSNTLLTASHHYLLQNPKLSASNKALVLEAINNVVSDMKIVNELDEQIVHLMINLATREMTMTSKDVDTDWAEAGKDVPVTLAKTPRFVTHVLDALLQKFPPGFTTSPHRYVVLTLATIAEHNLDSCIVLPISANSIFFRPLDEKRVDTVLFMHPSRFLVSSIQETESLIGN
ncbi:unnamed protein product [Cylicocyclus nassatus]|uniref:MROH2B-like N-terminal HEAT-repeats domain-containing protein n=1 Tax=Cylicocyclus nassatus TaxID=53992 RepID=A0AA36GG93_CYLNA|nr:unnamed protein product [Cylicocyclus nassatus]